MPRTERYSSFFVTILLFTILSATGQSYQPEKLNFRVKFKGLICPYKIFSVFVLPEEVIALEVLDENHDHEYQLKYERGSRLSGKYRWDCVAPKKAGLYKIEILNLTTQEYATLHMFVMVPYDRLRGEFLNGYRIGSYPKMSLNMMAIHKHPQGFVEVTDQNAETFVSPHFQLKQFLCKQNGGYPKYLVLKEKLLFKLELILERVNERGFQAMTFNILSGYRTPYYNKAIGNVKYSRHIFGGAADIFIDEGPKDDMMDDLNKDGKIDYRDAAIIYDIIEGMSGRPWYAFLVGGLGRYKKTPSHGPFVHVDVRGFRARWGT